MRRFLLDLVAVVLVPAATFAQEKAGGKEQERFQGFWQAVRVEKSGKQEAAAAVSSFTVLIKGNRVIFLNRGKAGEEITFQLDPEKDPKSIDMTPARGPRKGKLHPGIYKFDEDRLLICWDSPGKDRPTTFATKPETKLFLLEVKRSKKAP